MERKCTLCHQGGHYYRTCELVETYHEEIKDHFIQFVFDHALLSVDEAILFPCPWLKEYSLIVMKALAIKHGLRTTLRKSDYYILFKQLYFTLAFQDLRIFTLTDALLLLLNPVIFPIEFRLSEEKIDTFLCPICLDDIDDREKQVKLGCGHPFCIPCVNKYLNSVVDSHEIQPPTCALCRAQINVLEGHESAYSAMI